MRDAPSIRADWAKAMHVLKRLVSPTQLDEQRKEPFGVVEWRKMLTHPSYTKKAVDFMRRTRLLKQYKEVSWE